MSQAEPVGKRWLTKSARMNSPLIVDYYTDVLCIWAWIAQHRIDEIEKARAGQILQQHHFVNVFGDTGTRIGIPDQ